MSIKRFSGETWDDALRQVKAEYGDEAVILHSKTYKDGGILGVGQRSVVEITASDESAMMRRAVPDNLEMPSDTAVAPNPNYARLLEKAYAVASARAEEDGGGGASASGASSGGGTKPTGRIEGAVPLFRESKLAARQVQETAHIESLMNDVSELKALVAKLVVERDTVESLAETSPALQALYQRMLDNEVSRDYARKIVLAVNKELSGGALDDEERVREVALRIVADMVPVVGPLQMSAGRTTVIAMIGPTGVGKTTTLSKLAANLMIKHRNKTVGFITIDAYRLGATEQLKTVANVLGVPVRVVMNPNEVRSTLRELAHLDVVFIDTAGRSQHDRMRLNELKTFIDAANPDETHLCVSATTHPAHLLSVMDHFGALAVDRMVLTKLDEVVTFGPVLDVVMRAAKPLSYMTVGQNIPDDIEVASGERLARLLLGIEFIGS